MPRFFPALRTALRRLWRVCATALLLTNPAQAQPLNRGDIVEGLAVVVDGDTLDIIGAPGMPVTHIRIVGVDSPEWDQTCLDAQGRRYDCGLQAAQALYDLVADEIVTCRIIKPYPYRHRRTNEMVYLARCHVGPIDIGGAMVQAGHALAYRRYPEGRGYIADEAAAKLAKRGLWQGKFTEPEQWRRAKPR
ncbi:MAG: thermonuclease family protein [Candidatus Tectimicrobiota bacterium]